MWMFQQRRSHERVPQQQQQDEDDDEEEFVNPRRVVPNVNANTNTNTTDDNDEEEDMMDHATVPLHNRRTTISSETIELTNHHNHNSHNHRRSNTNEEFHDHPSNHHHTNDTNDNNINVEDEGRDHQQQQQQQQHYHDEEDPLQEQLRFSYERKTLLCNVFTLFVLFQMWFGWNDYTHDNDNGDGGENENENGFTLEGVIVTALFSLIVIGINIQMRYFYHEQWQEQSSQVFSLLPTSTSMDGSVTTTNTTTISNGDDHYDLELQSSSTTQRHGQRSQSQRQPLQQQQQQQRRFLTWDDILHLSQGTHESQNGQTHHHIDLSMLSYQAQLAYAIMESQRHIIETGGYGNPDGPENKQGVSIETIQSWKTFHYNPMVGGTIEDTGTDSMTDASTLPIKPLFDKEGPTCCICLCEYETNEELKEITPCGHWYHSDCILGWVKHHTTCPLCQVELE